MPDSSHPVRNSALLKVALKRFARAHIWVYRRTNGRLGSRMLWFPAALITTTGRKSGRSRTTPTLWVLVMAIGPSRYPPSCSQVVPVISPLPFRVNQAPKTGSALALPRGRTTVTPVRTGPFPGISLP